MKGGVFEESSLVMLYKKAAIFFYKKGTFKNFTKFTGKHLFQSLVFNKVAGLRSATLLKKETLAQVFSCEFCEIFKNTFFTEHIWTTASVYTILLLYY